MNGVAASTSSFTCGAPKPPPARVCSRIDPDPACLRHSSDQRRDWQSLSLSHSLGIYVLENSSQPVSTYIWSLNRKKIAHIFPFSIVNIIFLWYKYKLGFFPNCILSSELEMNLYEEEVAVFQNKHVGFFLNSDSTYTHTLSSSRLLVFHFYFPIYIFPDRSCFSSSMCGVCYIRVWFEKKILIPLK